MSRREALQKAHQELALRDRRRLFAVGLTCVFALALFVSLEFMGGKPEPAKIRDEGPDLSSLALAPLDREVLGAVRDGTLAEQVVVEEDAAAHLAANARTLTAAILMRLGEPAFPFAEAEPRAAELRGGLFRLRGTVVESGPRSRSGAEETWTILREESGHEAAFVSALAEERRWRPGQWVVADGYFLKRHSLPVGAERRVLPLFFGARLGASVPRAEPVSQPDLGLLASVRDTPMLVEESPDMDATWHLANVAQTLRADPAALEAAFADAPWLTVELLAKLNETPEAYRAAPLRVGGMVFHGARRAVDENPLRVQFLSEGWIRNSTFGRQPMLLRTPGRFDWEKAEGPWEFRGWFQQVWAYEDNELNEQGEGNWRRVPLFVFADARPIVAPTPPIAGQIVWLVLGIVVLIAAVLFVTVMRDRARARAAETSLTERRAKRRGA